MYQVWEVPARWLVAEAGHPDEALHQLDAECRRLHERAAADPDAPEAVYRFEVVRSEGVEVAWLTYSPDPTRPYVSVLVEETLTGGRS